MSAEPTYTELHARSAFSFLEGASSPEELAVVCKKHGMASMALLDRDGVYGAPQFYRAANNQLIRAHIGAEVTSAGGWRYPLLVKSRAGYQNLCRLITMMKLRAAKGEGEVSSPEVTERASGLICLTGGDEGPLQHALVHGGIERGTACVRELCGILGSENVYVELQRHFSRVEEARNQAAVIIARKLHLPLLATNGVCYALPQRREVLDVFTSIRNRRTLATAGHLLNSNSERYLKTPAEMNRLFADLPEAILNTGVLASRLEFSLKDLGYEFPNYPVPNGGTQIDFLRQLAYDGLIFRYGADNERARLQIERELKLIEKLHLEGYFLIVWDIVRFCREKNILVQGRGSAANSAVCYALRITAVDSVKMDLLFERFLSEERGEWPDIDLDLPSGDQRERAIQYVYERYGKLGAAMTANVITYRGKSAAREIGKVFSFDSETLGRLTSLVGRWEFHDPKDTLNCQFHDAGFDLRHPQIKKFFELCLEVQDLPRHLGQHSGGLVVCQGQLDSIVPLEPASMPGRVVVQWDKDDCADMKIVKVDLLGLGMMAVLEDSLQIIRKHHGEEIDLGRLPLDDDAVYDALQKADTVGMFQVESRAQMSCLPRLCPKEFYDIAVQVAIIRPGPIIGKMVNPYLKRRQGREAVDYMHSSLEPILKRTYGVPLFQEQLLRMAMIAAGFSGGEAEELRRAMGFKRSEKRMEEIGRKLQAGMERNGIAQEAQKKIIQSIKSFALFGFPESHAISFALIAYSSAYLKCHYLAAFTAAMLNNQPMGFYNPATLVKDAHRHGLKIRPIDVTCSDWLCTLEFYEGNFSMRLGMRYVKSLRVEIAEKIVQERAVQAFTSIEDIKLRVPEIQKTELTTLAEIGALNFIGGARGVHRRDALWQVERASRNAGPLFVEEARAENSEQLNANASPLRAMSPEERLVADFSGTGMTVGLHPMGYHRAEMKKLGVRSAIELATLPDGTFVRVAGGVIVRQRPGTAKGFCFLSLEDETGIANAILTPQVYEKNHLVIVRQQFLLVEGPLQNQDGVVSVKVAAVRGISISRAESVSHDFH
jgi:error-prone DNA polymerase